MCDSINIGNIKIYKNRHIYPPTGGNVRMHHKMNDSQVNNNMLVVKY